MARTEEKLRTELGEERVELTAAVENLRSRVDDTKRLASKLRFVAAGALGLSAAAKLFFSRKR